MTGKLSRSLAAALLLAGLAVPATAGPATSSPEPRPSLLFQVWERLAAPFVTWLDANTDGRGVWDPDGLTSPDPGGTGNDGRGMWDPNG
ncbi:MAG TPA: hypothetical protein VEW48_02150 [Thermoanaerobaculia bacterium]|nr:hypothetical protein [Thermoanaerobaculia bacterium]